MFLPLLNWFSTCTVGQIITISTSDHVYSHWPYPQPEEWTRHWCLLSSSASEATNQWSASQAITGRDYTPHWAVCHCSWNYLPCEGVNNHTKKNMLTIIIRLLMHVSVLVIPFFTNCSIAEAVTPEPLWCVCECVCSPHFWSLLTWQFNLMPAVL